MLIFGNKDKDSTSEKWKDIPNRDPLNFPHPYRCIITGEPSSGKSNTIRNIIIRANPRFKHYHLVHYGLGDTKEWECIDWTSKSDQIPDPHMFTSTEKSLLIIEDMSMRKLPKESLKKLSRLFGYASSHHNLSIFLTAQDPMGVPPCVRRSSNVFIMCRSPDLYALSLLASRSGYKAQDFQYLFSKYIHQPFDNLMIDLTVNSPFPLRINGYQIIDYDKTTSTEILPEN